MSHAQIMQGGSRILSPRYALSLFFLNFIVPSLSVPDTFQGSYFWRDILRNITIGMKTTLLVSGRVRNAEVYTAEIQVANWT